MAQHDEHRLAYGTAGRIKRDESPRLPDMPSGLQKKRRLDYKEASADVMAPGKREERRHAVTRGEPLRGKRHKAR